MTVYFDISIALEKNQIWLRRTPGGMRRPQKTAPSTGTTLAILPGTPNENRRDSFTTARC